MFKKFINDPSVVMPIENVVVKDNLSYEEVYLNFRLSGLQVEN